MIPYVQSAASLEVPPPYHFPGVTVNAFVWDAKMAPIQAYCDRYFNLGADEDRGFSYKAAAFWPYALLLFIDYPVMISASRTPESVLHEVPYSDRGVVTQRECFVALPVMRYGPKGAQVILDSTLQWALPFIVVEQPMSAVCGREMLGLEKLQAKIDIGESSFPDSFRGRISLPGWTSRVAGELQQQLPFLDVDTGAAVPTFRGSPNATSPWTLFRSREAAGLIGSLAALGDFVDVASLGTLPTEMRTISLKQFRDALEPEKALYQALVSCRSKYSNIENFRFYNENDVTITFHDEGSFDDILRVFLELPAEGSPTKNAGPPYVFMPRAAYRFNANIDFDQMRTVHTFDTGPGTDPRALAANGGLIAPWLKPWRGLFARPKP